MAARGALGRVPRVPRPAGGTARADRARRRATGAGGAARSRCPPPLLPARRRAAAATGALARAAATRVGGHRGARARRRLVPPGRIPHRPPPPRPPRPTPAPAAALAAPAAPSAVRWETISWDTARAILGVDPARILNLPAVAKRSSAADRVVLVEQQLASGTVVRLHERPAAEGAPGMEVGASERLARYVGNLRVEIEGALPPDSLSKLLELVK